MAQELRLLNHNLLPVLLALLRERNVTRAAETLGITQPAASAALARLRLMLHDPLLVKIGRKMELSPRAAALFPQVEEVCSGLERLWRNPNFDPMTADRCFTFTSPDYVQVLVAPPLIRSLAVHAPLVSLRFLDVPVEDVTRRKVTEIDFAIGMRQTFERPSATDFVVQTLYHEQIVAVVGPQHRLHGAKNIERKDYERDSFLVFLAGAQFLEKRYDALREAVTAPGTALAMSQHYNSLMLIALQTDAVALIPRRLAVFAETITRLRIIDIDYSDFQVDVCLAWDKRWEGDPAHAWLRTCIRRATDHLRRDKLRAPPNIAASSTSPHRKL